MALKQIKQLVTPDRLMNQIQSNIAQAFRQITKLQILDGKLIQKVSLSASTDKTINHGLGREPTGWFITRKDSDANVWDKQSSNNLSNKTLVLTSDADCNIDLWVF